MAKRDWTLFEKMIDDQVHPQVIAREMNMDISDLRKAIYKRYKMRFWEIRKYRKEQLPIEKEEKKIRLLQRYTEVTFDREGTNWIFGADINLPFMNNYFRKRFKPIIEDSDDTEEERENRQTFRLAKGR